MKHQIMIVGEAWGKDEEEAQAPFVGASGKLLNSLLSAAGIERSECYLTNVFNLRPQPRNDVENLCGPKSEGIQWMPYLRSSKYVRKEYEPEVLRLYDEVARVKPNLIIAMGATPSWAFLRQAGIKKVRGAPAHAHDDVLERTGLKELKVLPTYHPAAVLREWKLRPIVIADLVKAQREAQFPEVRRPEREVWIEPTIPDLWEFYTNHILPNPRLSIDIETKGDQITCIGFAPTKSIALVVPFFSAKHRDLNYWRTRREELAAWKFVKQVCELPGKEIVGQNFNYDIKFLLRQYGIRVPGAADDTMLLHHALQPEMEKGLGFLGTIYTNEASWKFMRTNAAAKGTLKKED